MSKPIESFLQYSDKYPSMLQNSLPDVALYESINPTSYVKLPELENVTAEYYSKPSNVPYYFAKVVQMEPYAPKPMVSERMHDLDSPAAVAARRFDVNDFEAAWPNKTAETLEADDAVNPDDAEAVQAAANLYETRGFVRQAPIFYGQVLDKTRTSTFVTTEGVEYTEYEGLVELWNFLKGAATQPYNIYHQAPARDMLQNISFIGQPEFEEATPVMAQSWKNYLDADPERQLLVAAYDPNPSIPKSGQYVLNAVLGHFSDEELETKYRHRLLLHGSQIVAPPRATRTVLADDWSVSGIQMQSAMSRVVATLPTHDRDAYRDTLEINLLAASEQRLHNGFEPCSANGGKVAVRGYFRMHNVDTAEYGVSNGSRHSTVDYGFKDPLLAMTNWPFNGRHQELPALAKIKPDYTDKTNILRLASINDDTMSKNVA